MRAALFTEHGGPEKIQIQTVPDPSPGPGEAVIHVKACALNHLDLWVLQGLPAYPVKRPHVLGNDVSGIVLAVGEGVSSLRPGQRVIASPGLSCFQCTPCRAGQDNLCESFSFLGAKQWGGFAEKLKVKADSLLPIADTLSFEEAAAFPLTYVTAWHMLVTQAGLKKGDSVLVIGASSGVGSAAIQIAKLHGARVLATVSSSEKIPQARASGADAVVDSSQESISHVARAFTHKRGMDIAFEHVGPATWEHSLGSLAPGGRLVTCGATSGPEVKLDLRYVFSRELSILGNRGGTRAELKEIVRLMGEKKLHPVISQTYPLSEARMALEYLQNRKQFGKILLLP